jgi:hypothetical protein
MGRDGGINKFDLGLRRSEIFLQRGLDTRIEKLPVGQITIWRSSKSRLRRVSILVFGELLVDPSPAVMAPPDLAGQQASSD